MSTIKTLIWNKWWYIHMFSLVSCTILIFKKWSFIIFEINILNSSKIQPDWTSFSYLIMSSLSHSQILYRCCLSPRHSHSKLTALWMIDVCAPQILHWESLPLRSLPRQCLPNPAPQKREGFLLCCPTVQNSAQSTCHHPVICLLWENRNSMRLEIWLRLAILWKLSSKEEKILQVKIANSNAKHLKSFKNLKREIQY